MFKDEKPKAIIIGAGPAGLTAALELLRKTNIIPIVLEADDQVGGIARTEVYKGNRIDIGGHRFFSKSKLVMNWWREILPQQGFPSSDDLRINRKVPLQSGGPDPQNTDQVMLVRNRVSRIYFLRKFFPYPIGLSKATIANLGLIRLVRITLSYIKWNIFPPKKQDTLEDFLIYRFGKELYLTFFKDYTEKVWGVPCNKIKAEWGWQRIKGLSIKRALAHAIQSPLKKKGEDISQKNTETSLIERFLYPKLGPGQMWEEVTRRIRELGGEVLLNHPVTSIEMTGTNIHQVQALHKGKKVSFNGDYFFSSTAIKNLVQMIKPEVPPEVQRVAKGLVYRDFLTVGLLVEKLLIRNTTGFKSMHDIPPDNWIYIQERDVKVGRLQIFNNWSPYLVQDDTKVWLGLEYFCNEGDSLWTMKDPELIELGKTELNHIGIINKEDVVDATVIRMPKAYPAYFGTYDEINKVREFTDQIENLFLVGRNGMHKYNNQDHSMLSAIASVENIIAGRKSKDNIWDVNAEKDYHEHSEKNS